MTLGHWLLWGFGATVVLTILLSAAHELRLTRVSWPLLLGALITSRRDRAKVIGFVIHLAGGWLFALLYLGWFHSLGGAGPLRGALLGLIHAGFVLFVVFPLLPGLHPRMATEQHGPTATRQLEPPGALGLNYGVGTPSTIIVAHMVFGIILGCLYR